MHLSLVQKSSPQLCFAEDRANPPTFRGEEKFPSRKPRRKGLAIERAAFGN